MQARGSGEAWAERGVVERAAATWRAEPDPGFRKAVWSRIEAGRGDLGLASWLTVWRWRVAFGAAGGVMAAVAVGLAAGLAGRSAARDTAVARYVAAIDPHVRVVGEAGR